jgi:hypothetical protein
MSARKILPSTPATQPARAMKRIRAHASRHARKSNSHTALTKSELEKMMLDAARLRAIYAHSDE